MEIIESKSSEQQKDPPLNDENGKNTQVFYDFPTIQDNDDIYVMRGKEKSLSYVFTSKETSPCQKNIEHISGENENCSEKLNEVNKNFKNILQKSISETQEYKHKDHVQQKIQICSQKKNNLSLNENKNKNENENVDLQTNEIKLINRSNSPQKYQQQKKLDQDRKKINGSSFQSINTKSSIGNYEQTLYSCANEMNENCSPQNSVSQLSESKSGFISPKKSFLAKRKNNSRFSERFINNLQIQTQNQQQLRKCSDPLQKRISDPFNQKYDVYEKIGEGSTSTVKRCRIRDQQKNYAVKIQNFKADETLINDILREQRILSIMKHRNIIKSVFFEIDRSTRTSYIGMELVKGEQIGSLIKRGYNFSINQIRKIMIQILQAVEYMHNQGICHRDLSFNNIIYDEKFELIKIIDFSSSLFVLDKNSLFGDEGTLHFKAPETLKGENQLKNIDMWAVGVSLYAMINGNLPFTGNSNKQIVESITGFKGFKKEDLKIKDENLLDLLNNLLCQDPLKRINATDALESPFLTKKMGKEDFYLQFIDWEKIKKINIFKFMVRKSSVEDPAIRNLFSGNLIQNKNEFKMNGKKSFLNSSQQLKHTNSLTINNE